MEGTYFWLYFITLVMISGLILTCQRLNYCEKNIDKEWNINVKQSCKIQELEWKLKYMKDDIDQIQKGK